MTAAVDGPFLRTAQSLTRYQAWKSEVMCLMEDSGLYLTENALCLQLES
jgi:hypothetical protein